MELHAPLSIGFDALLFLFMFSELIYSHLDSNNLIPVEKKGCHKGSCGTKDQLLVDRLVVEIARCTFKNLLWRPT